MTGISKCLPQWFQTLFSVQLKSNQRLPSRWLKRLERDCFVETVCISRSVIVCSFHFTLCQSLNPTLLRGQFCVTSSPFAQSQPQPQSQPLSSTTIKLDNIKPLTGSDNYEAWSCQLSLILFAIGAKDLVVSGVKSDDMTNDRKAQLLQQAILIIIQLVMPKSQICPMPTRCGFTSAKATSRTPISASYTK